VRGLDKAQRLVNDKRFLERITVFILLYIGWTLFTLVYNFIKPYSRNLTSEFLKLPLMSRSFTVGMVSMIEGIKPLYYFLSGIYFLGFTGSIGLAVFYLLFVREDYQASDELALRYLLAYVTCGLIYSVFHIYAPHIVYHLNGYYPDNSGLTQQEFVFPSLHNTIAAINLITVWKYRDRIGGKVIIALSTLIPFATVLLGQHWVYDALAGMGLAALLSKITEGKTIVPGFVRRMSYEGVRRMTVLSGALAALLFSAIFLVYG